MKMKGQHHVPTPPPTSPPTHPLPPNVTDGAFISSAVQLPGSLPPAGLVSVTPSEKVITSHDGRFSVRAPRSDLFKATLTATVSGNQYTYILHNDETSLQPIDSILFEGGDFESFQVFDANWEVGILSITPALDPETFFKPGLAPGKTLTFYAVAAEGFTPGDVRVRLLSNPHLASARKMSTARPSQIPGAEVTGDLWKDAPREFIEFVHSQLADFGMVVTVAGPSPR